MASDERSPIEKARSRIAKTGKTGSLDFTKFGLDADDLALLIPELAALTSLTNLFLGHNRIAVVPPELATLSSLTELYLHNNQITVVPPEIATLTNLTTLVLGANQIAVVPPELAALTNLKALDLGDNQIAAVPPELAALTNLKALALGDNKIPVVPPEIAALTNLTKLDLSNNQLAEVPRELVALTNLTELRLSRNKIAVVPPEIAALTNLTELYLDNNQIAELPPEIAALTNLTKLDLSRNEIAVVPPEIAALTNLTELYLHNNQIAEVPPELAALTSLTDLYLRDNQIAVVPPEIAALTNLKELYLDNNQIAEVPPEISELSNLRELSLVGNALPDEILRLAELGDLKGLRVYLRSLADGGTRRPFNEAKLLLIGPGEVGKTFLLQALQGKKPVAKGSTKGVEIAREPMDLHHPTQKKRTLHLNCWDFGGQELYQITHQIFFSATAIYLLVWKPRPGIDPGLEDRLERIRLSAGKNAKVFIVSTHADGDVPAVIGEQALRDRFGDMIAGFHAVDSKKGTKGTGIEKLRKEIAKAAAELDGMDTPFAESWIKAQNSIRSMNDPSITFGSFVEECAKHGLDGQAAATLAKIMDIQGNATYFDDTATPDGVKGHDNIVVLRPEWLAKAVTFVLEDKKVLEQKESGVLPHGRLPEIWKKIEDTGSVSRKCLYDFLLWLMWKFDIAYKQSKNSSLVPELIQRNQPDDLRWTPTKPPKPPTGQLQATLICRMNQTIPLGIVPVLTAATHPLRRVRIRGGDKLDQNWRTGFFLDTALRGAAFVDLDKEPRELKVTVRDAYPADLVRQVRSTLERIIKERWPNLDHHFAVPCVTMNGGAACQGRFRFDFLESRPGQKVPCQTCNAELEVDQLLYGFDARGEEARVMLGALQAGQLDLRKGMNDLKAGQDQLLTVAIRLYRDVLDPHFHVLRQAPCMLSVVPEKSAWSDVLKSATESNFRVQCWCEHPDGPHRDVPRGKSATVEHVLRGSKEWVSAIAPYVRWSSGLLKAMVPVAGGVVKEVTEAVVADVELMGQITSSMPNESVKFPGSSGSDMMHGVRPEVEALSSLHKAMLKQWPEDKRWGGLRPVLANTGQVLWLCEEHAAIQSQPRPETMK